MCTPMFSFYGKAKLPEEQYTCADPPVMTVEVDRKTVDTSWQQSASGDKYSKLENLFYDLQTRVTQLEEIVKKEKVCPDFVDTQLLNSQRQYAVIDHDKVQTSNVDLPYQEGHRSHQEAIPGYVTQKEFQEKEDENKKLKEKAKELEARHKELLSKVMGMHKDSENMNDPSRLSAVMEDYELLKIQDWGKLRKHTLHSLPYKQGSTIIKRLFDACEKDVQQKTCSIFEVLEIPTSSDATTPNEQAMKQEIMNILRYSYYQKHSKSYNKIVADPPVKASWVPLAMSTQYLEHVDKKDPENWTGSLLLWPVMMRGEQVVAKGVIWDEV